MSFYVYPAMPLNSDHMSEAPAQRQAEVFLDFWKVKGKVDSTLLGPTRKEKCEKGWFGIG